jgi:hypothetical protein
MSYATDYNYWSNSGIFPKKDKFGNLIYDKIKQLDTKFYIYRYTNSDKEVEFIKKRMMVFSTNPYGTYWTTLLTDDPKEAMKLLALPKEPKYRIGGIPIAGLDHAIIKYQGRVKPKYGQPGGAWEIVITAPIMIVSLCDISQTPPKIEDFW